MVMAVPPDGLRRFSPVVTTKRDLTIDRDIPGKEVDHDMLTSPASISRRLARMFLFPVLVAALPPVPASADCLLDYVGCVEAASDLGNFGRRSIAGIGCYADLLSCIQRRLA